MPTTGEDYSISVMFYFKTGYISVVSEVHYSIYKYHLYVS